MREQVAGRSNLHTELAGLLSLPFLGLAFWWLAGSVGLRCCLADVSGGEPCRADGACWGGWGLIPLRSPNRPHPPQPRTPPSRHGSLRCVWGAQAKCQVSFSPVLVWACGDSPLEAGGRATTSARSQRDHPATATAGLKPCRQAHTGSRTRGDRSGNLCCFGVRRTGSLSGRKSERRHSKTGRPRPTISASTLKMTAQPFPGLKASNAERMSGYKPEHAQRKRQAERMASRVERDQPLRHRCSPHAVPL